MIVNIALRFFVRTALVNNKAKAGQPEEALKIIDQITRIGVKTTAPMFTSVLKAFVDNHKFDQANELWIRMHDEGIDLEPPAFSVMIKLCARTHNAERALFYVDEMKALKLEPDLHIFSALFRACAEAPHWVKGYEDIIYDAMCVMEGCELIPTAEIYNSIIFAFAKAGQPIAAEFYFWEMRAKGLATSATTYNSLLLALSNSQSTWAGRYGRLVVLSLIWCIAKSKFFSTE